MILLLSFTQRPLPRLQIPHCHGLRFSLRACILLWVVLVSVFALLWGLSPAQAAECEVGVNVNSFQKLYRCRARGHRRPIGRLRRPLRAYLFAAG